MIVNVCSYKGGVGKTTSAVHFAAYLSRLAPTVLIDGDPNRSASVWAKAGKLPFPVIDERLAVRQARDYQHHVIDTQARPTEEDLEVLSRGCDLLVIPTTPDSLSLDAMMLTVKALHNIGARNYQILITIVPPRPSRDGEEAYRMLSGAKLPVFRSVVRRFVAFQKAALAKVPVYEVEDARAIEAWNDYQAVCQELAV